MRHNAAILKLLVGEGIRSAAAIACAPWSWLWASLSPAPQSLLFAPQDIRTADPTLADDIYAGYFSFKGKTVKVDGHSPFEINPPSHEWAKALHSFEWLRHLRAADTALARMNAHALIEDWLNLGAKQPAATVWAADVTARRLIVWLSQSPLILDQVDLQFYRRFMRAIGRATRHLIRCLDSGLDGQVKILALLAITEVSLSADSLGRMRKIYSKKLMRELDRQILRDGGHISRNPQVLIELMLDLLPLRQLYVARGLNPPDGLQNAMDRILPMLRMFRHSDGGMALFNGMGTNQPDLLATLFAYEDTEVEPVLNADLSGYQRREAGSSVLIMDTGLPPKGQLSGEAHASALAFEFSSGAAKLITNCGAAQTYQMAFRRASRLTAAHSTLIYQGSSSASFLPPKLEPRFGGRILSGPQRIELSSHSNHDGFTLDAQHDGYRHKNILHRRKLNLSSDGLQLSGQDELVLLKNQQAAHHQSSLRFHLEPTTQIQRCDVPGRLLLTLADGQNWLFNVENESADIEESIHFADPSGVKRSLQIAVHSTASLLNWTFQSLSSEAEQNQSST
eukprot:gene12735-12831_t